MTIQTLKARVCALLAAAAHLLGIAGCSSQSELETAGLDVKTEAPLYCIGPGDSLEIFVWCNEDISRSVTVCPDGRITVPLVKDLEVTDRTASELARENEEAVAVYF